MSSASTESTPLVGKQLQYSTQVDNDDEEKCQLGISKLAKHQPTIGFIGSIAIAVNSLTGPAMLNLPATFQQSGLIPTTATLIFVCVLASFCSLHIANTISKVPDNEHFTKEIEFSEAFLRFWGRRWFVITQVIFFLCVSCLNVSSIVDTAQVVDTFVGHWTPMGSLALQFKSTGIVHFVRWDPSHCDDECIPFAGHSGVLLTAGYMIVVGIFTPLALMDLKENAIWQVVGFVILLLTGIQFAIEFLWSGLDRNNVSLWGKSWYDLFGVVLFNFALVIAIPAWLYEKKPSIDVPTVVWTSSGMSTILYVSCGALGALAIPNVSDNMLESMMSGAYGTSMQLGGSVFAFMIIGLGIPLFSVLTRMNLTGSGLSLRMGNALAVYLPFSVSWMLYQGDAITTLLAWGGVLFTSAVAFILPLLLALHTVVEIDAEGAIAVYGRWFKSRESQRRALVILLGLAVVSVVSAIAGLVYVRIES